MPVSALIQSVCLVAALALPVAGSFWAWSAGPRPATVGAAARRPALAFDQYLVDLGPVEPTDELHARFGFTNLGTEPVSITSWEVSCGCLKPSLKERNYAPGQSGAFYLKTRTANEAPGPHEYRLTLKYTDPEPRQQTLVFRAVLPESQVLVRPRALIVYQLNGQPTEQELHVTDLRPNRLNLLGARCNSDLVDLEIRPRAVQVEGDVAQVVAVTVRGQVPPGRHMGLITIFTDDAVYPELKVPVMIHGPGAKLPGLARQPGNALRQ